MAKRGRKPKDKENELLELVQANVDEAKEKQEMELVSIEQVEAMSMTQVLAEKNQLSARRQQVMLQLDGKRLDQAVKIMDAMDMALDKMINQCSYDQEGNLIEMTAFDFKLYTDAYKNLAQTLNTVSRLDSVDTGGKATRLSIEVQWG